MAWNTPKTDWVASDYFNLSDYNRIKGNLEEVHFIAENFFIMRSLYPMAEKSAYTDYPYASTINALEDNLEQINQDTYQFGTTEKPVYAANQPTPNWQEFNRIESLTLKLYDEMLVQYKNLPRLELICGAERKIKI